MIIHLESVSSTMDAARALIPQKPEDGTAVFTPAEAGTFTIKATAADPSGNKTEKTLKITVFPPAGAMSRTLMQ